MTRAPGWIEPLRHTVILALCASCSSEPIDLGSDPDFVWWTDHESGDLSDWQAHGVDWTNGGGELAVVDQPTRSGQHAVRATVVPQPTGTLSAGVLILEDLPSASYVGAWFYLPHAVAEVGYWVFFKLGSRNVFDDPESFVDVWDFNLKPDGDEVSIQPVPRLGQQLDPLREHTVPIGRWFRVECFLHASPDEEGVLRLWLDDELLVEHRGPTAPSRFFTWTVGGGAEGLVSGDATLIIDDAAVTERRLGTSFPAFWRP